MIDPKLLRDQPDLIRESQSKRGESETLVDELVAADADRRSAITTFENLRAEQKAMGKQVAKASGDEKAALLARTKELAAGVKQAQADQTAAAEQYAKLLDGLSNVVSEQAPAGGEDDYVVLSHHGEPREFDFEPRDHVELGKILGAIDIERGAKVSGARFYFLTGQGALLELALVNYAIASALRNGFTPVIPPALVRPAAMAGTGFLGQAADDVYHLPADDLYLVGTSEVALAAYHSDEALDAAKLPLRYVGYSPCYRREAGSYGKDTAGIIRVHWFDKVEMFSYVAPEDAVAEHERLLEWEKEFLSSLGLAYRVIDVAAGDLGLSAARKFDCEAWIPTQGRYRELTSTSNCTEFQARRLNIRMRDESGTRPLATLNGTLCAMARTIVAILETHQNADGSVTVPEPLRPFLGRDVLEPIA